MRCAYEGGGEYIQGAKPGMIINSVSKKLYDGRKGINVLRCYYKREFVEWQDRGKGDSAPVALAVGRPPSIHKYSASTAITINPPLIFKKQILSLAMKSW